MFLVGVLVSMITGALVNEFSEIAPWLAQKIVRRAARLWALGDRNATEGLAEEWAAVLDAAPGKLTKLCHALVFVAGAAWRFQRHRVREWILRLVESSTVMTIESATGRLRSDIKRTRELDIKRARELDRMFDELKYDEDVKRHISFHLGREHDLPLQHRDG